jgi:hypothetical protein
MEQFIRTAARTLDRRSFFRGLGKWGMGAAAVAGVLLLPKKAQAQETDCNLPDYTGPVFCRNNGGPCEGVRVDAGSADNSCNGHPTKICISREPDNFCNPRCQCVGL